VRTLLIILLLPVFSYASCGTHRLAYYASLLRQDRFDAAFNLVMKDLGATPEDRQAISLETTAAVREHSDYALSRQDLQESKSVACQRAANILSKVREKRRVNKTLHQYHNEWEAASTRWSGCNVDGKDLTDPAVAAPLSMQCLQAAGFSTYVTAREIRALLFQSHAADVPRLGDEDVEVLLMQMRLFSDGMGTLDDSLTDSYYLPSLKRIDKDSFCQGVRYVRDTLVQRGAETSKWQKACLAGSRDRPSSQTTSQ